MSADKIDFHYADCIERFKTELSHITYLFDLLFTTEEFYGDKIEADWETKAADCCAALTDNFKRLQYFNEKFRAFSDCVRDGKRFDGDIP